MLFKIYYLQPALLGSLSRWPSHLDRCREMGFNHLCISPPFLPTSTGNVFDVASHDQTHPAFDGETVDALVSGIADACRARELTLLLDLVLDRMAPEHPLVGTHRAWFRTARDLDDLPDPRRPSINPHHARARFDDPVVADELGEWWRARLRHWANLGVAGFRCLDPERVPASLWRSLTDSCEAQFLAWTPGVARRDLSRIRGAGFAAVFSSAAWWDGKAAWFVEEHDMLRQIAPVIATTEPVFGPRLAQGAHERALSVAAATGAGLLMPIGFERAFSRALDPSLADPDEFERDWNESPIDLKDAVARATALADNLADLAGGEMRVLENGPNAPTALLRANRPDVRRAEAAAVVLINAEERPLMPASTASILSSSAGASLGDVETAVENLPLEPGAVRVLRVKPLPPVKRRPPPARAAALKAAQSPRIVVEKVVPSVDGGRFAAKCVIGAPVAIGADIYTDGHELLAAEIAWKAADETEWRRAPLEPVGNDRWQASVTFSRVGRHSFTVEAWWNVFGTFRRELDLKRKAGVPISLEIEEGRRLVDEAAGRTKGQTKSALRGVLKSMTKAADEACADCLLSAETAAAMADADPRPFLARSEPIPVEAERPQAAFASWYEMFPRSATDDPARHGTFLDVIRRLRDIRAMGFDVLYFPPIHPIGSTHRKGRNNSLTAAPDDIGSPYAIGADTGGHDAIHPDLGTPDDFRALVRAAHDHGLEIALDFAIQCSPDHPWIKQHPGWFRWRPDGSIRFAENPPKKYEDIVNVDFFAEDAVPGLWIALRDAVLHWVDEGVRIFRVDNPHTKPLAFWEWMIADVRARHPDVIFLSEAFTRPKPMYRLAKVGFSQSYTYFTWRNTKRELTEYLTELSTTEVKDYFRPHFFVNTPDINPIFLQTSGRGGFLIRAALAATLSGLWGVYSGFEHCEAAPVPGKEEYLDSEKYELRPRSPRSPDDIVDEIATLNRIRKSHPELQTHLGVRFYQAFNDQILIYGKARSPLTEMILVAVSLDPHRVQETSFEVPLWEWGLGDDRSMTVEDLISGRQLAWHGKMQRVRLDPHDLPFAIWKISPEGRP